MKLDCIVLDLDETLLDSHGRLSPVNRSALEQAIADGTEVVLASGRALHTFPLELVSFPGIRYVITGNGTSIVDLSTEKAILQRFLPEEAVKALLHSTKGLPLVYEAFVDGKAYTDQEYIDFPEHFGADENVMGYVRRTRQGIEDMRGFMWAHRRELDAIDLISHDPLLRARALEAVKRSGAEVYITSSVPRMIEISHKDGGKGPALLYLLDYLRLDIEKTAAFGNADNDVEMLAAVKYGIAVENASAACKAAACYVSAHHNEDGVAKGLAHLAGIFNNL